MSKKYQVIARKYRPQTFAEVVGQTSAVTTLKNAIRFQKIAHAYLFCGTRGVGKTTLARLFAKALNCSAPTQDLEPCGTCPSCIDIAAGQSLDVIEIDGASNRGIDDIRQINETVGYAPSHGRYKIYIIDEVHMLTKEAFNALLKTLEEPPATAKFFFATTEAHKVLPTILSRCQRFDLARISKEQIAAKLKEIALDLSRTVDQDALDLVAAFADGSMRDGESLFDQILCFAQDPVTENAVRSSLGLVAKELFLSLDQAFSAYDLSYAFRLVETLMETGKDLGHFLEQLVEHYRNLNYHKITGSNPPQYTQSLPLYTKAQLLHILDLVIQAESTFQKSPFPRVTLESILLQIIRSRHRIPIETIVRKLTETDPPLTTAPTHPTETLSPAEKIPVPAEKVESPVVEAPPVEKAPIIEAPPIEKAPTLVEKIEPPVADAIIPAKPPVVEMVAPVKPPVAEALAPKEKAQPAATIAATGSPLSLEPVPFQPQAKLTPAVEKPPVTTGKQSADYATLLRFASIELEGTVK